MRKIKNIFMNLLGAAVLTAGLAGAAAAQFSGSFAPGDGGVTYDGGTDQLNTIYHAGAGLAVDNVAPGGPFTYAVTVSSDAGVGLSYLIIKYGPAGVVVSSVSFYTGDTLGDPNTKNAAVAIGGGFVYVAASVAEDPYSSSSALDGLLLKYNLGLGLISSATYSAGTVGNIDTFHAIAADGTAVYVTGTSQINAADGIIVTLKYSPEFVMLSSSTFDVTGTGRYDIGNGLALTTNNVYIAAQTYSIPLADSVCGILKLDRTDMAFVSSAAYSATEKGACNAIAAAEPLGAVFVGGYSMFNTSWTALNARYDLNLVLQATTTVPSVNFKYDETNAIVLDTAGNVYTTGRYDNQLGTVFKYDQYLNFVSSDGTQGLASDIGFGLAADAADNVYLAKYSSNGFNDTLVVQRFTQADFLPTRQISGTVTYGAYGPEVSLTIWVSTSPDFRGTQYYTTIPSPSAAQVYTISNVPPGIYYMAMTASVDWQVIDSTEAWGVYGQLGTPTPVNITDSDVTSIDVALIDGNSIPNPFSPEGQAPAQVNCVGVYSVGGECRINGNTTFGTGIATDISDNRYLALTNLTDSAIVKFDTLGDVVSSVTVKYTTFNDIKRSPYNSNIYVAAQGPESGIHLYRYDSNLVLMSSASVPGYQGARQLDFDTSGNVYAVSTKLNNDADIRVVKLPADLSGLTDDWSEVINGPDQGLGIFVDGTDVFVAGVQHPGSVNEAVAIKVSAVETMTTADAATAYTLPFLFPEGQGFNNVRVTADTSGVYLAYSADLLTSTGTVIYRFDRLEMDTLPYSSATMTGVYNFGEMKLSGTYLYVAGQTEVNQARVTKYDATTFAPVASAVTAVPNAYGFSPGGMAFDVYGTASEIYLSGVLPDVSGGVSAGAAEIALVNGQVPTDEEPEVPGTVFVSAADVSPASYFANLEAAALKITLSSPTLISGLTVNVNPVGVSTHVAYVAAYVDTNMNGIWEPGRYDALLASGAVTGASHYLDLNALSGTAQNDIFITLTPDAEAQGRSVNLSVLSAGDFVVNGDIDAGSVFPMAATPKEVQAFAPVSDLSAGAGLTSVTLSWTYPQDITAGHYLVSYSTNPSDLLNAEAYGILEPISAITANTVAAPSTIALTPVAGLRVFPYYFAVRLYNGASTTTLSNVAQNMYFPGTETAAGDAVLELTESMTLNPGGSVSEGGAMSQGNNTRFARLGMDRYSAFAFTADSVNYITLNTPGGSYYYRDNSEALDLRDLAVDPSGYAYLLLQKGADTTLVVKVAPNGNIVGSPFTLTPDPVETPKAMVFGGGALYYASVFTTVDNTDIALRKLNPSTLAVISSVTYASADNSNDMVNSLSYTSDQVRAYIYVAGYAGEKYDAVNYTYLPKFGIIHKFADLGGAFTNSTVTVAGNWPVRYFNPEANEAAAMRVKTDLNGDLVVTGYEYRYRLQQGANIWLNKYNPFGSPLFAVPARYNNAQSNWDDVPTGLDFDNFGNIYVSGYTDMNNYGRGYDLLLAKFGPGGAFQSERIYDGGGYRDGFASDVFVSSDNYAHVAGVFGMMNNAGVYSAPLQSGGSVNTQFFNASEGPYTGSVELMWNYPGALPASSEYRIQYSADPYPVWNSASAQIVVATGPVLYPGAVQSHRIGALPTQRYSAQLAAMDNRGNEYKFKVWVTSGGVTTGLPEAATFARTPSAYDYSRYNDAARLERLSYMSGLSGPSNAIEIDGPYVYQAFAGRADGSNAGFGLRRYNSDQYLDWTKFYNHRLNRNYQVGGLTRDGYGNFYLVGSQYQAEDNSASPEINMPGKDIWIAKLDANGDLVWNYSVDASSAAQMDELYYAAVEGDYLYAVGVTSVPAGDLDVLAVKYNVASAAGPILVWTQRFGGSGYDYGYGVAIGTGAVYLAGTVVNSDKDIFIRALSKVTAAPVGDLITHDSGGTDEGYALALVTENDGATYAYVAGSTAAASGNSDAALFKFNIGGAFTWGRYFNGKEGRDDAYYAVKANGAGVVVAGYSDSVPDGRNSAFRKYAFDGTESWTRVFNLVDQDGDPATAAYGHDDAYGLALDEATGRVYASVALWGNYPGFYFFPQPNEEMMVMASPNYVPGSVRLDWMNRLELPAGSTFYIQYALSSSVAWSSASAQVRYVTDYDMYEGMNVSRVVYGLNNGRDAAGAPLGSAYYFKIWAAPNGSAPILVWDNAVSARASDGWAFETVAMYPNEAKLFVMGTEQDYSGEAGFPGIARDSLGNIYTLANTNWNGNGGFALKKFSPAFAPLWTRYYAPGERYQVKANRLAVDDSGLYVTGYEWNTSGNTNKDLFVMKFNADGVAWKSVYDFAGGDDIGYGVAVDASGNTYVAGSVYTGVVQDRNAFLAKFSPAGVLLSTVTYNGSANGPDAAYGVAVYGANIYAAGFSSETGEATQLWAGRYGAPALGQVTAINDGLDDTGSYTEAAYDVAVDTSGYVYFAGQRYNSGSSSVDAVLYKRANTLAAEWAEPLVFGSQGGGIDAAHGIKIGPYGSVYMAGYSERYDINQDRNLWLRRCSPDGIELGAQEFHANAINAPNIYYYGPSSDEGYALVVDPAGYVTVSGRFAGLNGVYRYRQVSTLAVNPTLTVNVYNTTSSTAFPGVGVALIPFAATGGLDTANISTRTTDAVGRAVFQVPAGKDYFIALDKHGYNPGIKDQQMDPYGNFFVTLNSDLTKNYILSPRPASDPYYPLAVTVTSVTARDYIVAEVFYTQTGEKAAYALGYVPVDRSSVTFAVNNVPPASYAGDLTLGITIPGRNLARSVRLNALAANTTNAYTVAMSTDLAVATSGGFDVAASTTPPNVEGVVRNEATYAPIEQVRVRVFNRMADPCFGEMCEYNSYETLTDVNGKYSFYNLISTAAPYNMVAQKAGYARGWRESFNVSGPGLPTVYRDFFLEQSTYTLRGVISYRGTPLPNADVMIWGDYNSYGGSDSYRNHQGMDTDARTRTGADGSFVFSPGTLNALPDGQVNMSVAYMGNWMQVTEGNNQDFADVDSDDVRIVISSAGASWTSLQAQGNCAPGRVWKVRADTGFCISTGAVSFNIQPPNQTDNATLLGAVTFVTTFTVSEASPLVISSAAPITVMVMEECNDCKNRSMGFAIISGTYTVNRATYSIDTLSMGTTYYTRIISNEWGELSSFDDRANFASTNTVRMNFVVTRAGAITGVVKLPDGSNFKPTTHRLDVRVSGQNVSVYEGWGLDDYGAFEFPNLPPGLYTVTLKPEGDTPFPWATPTVADIAVVAGKTTQVTLKLEAGLYVQPNIIGLEAISTPTWHYVMLPVPSGTEMNQAKITDMFFGDNVFAFDYDASSRTWESKIMQAGQYDFYLLLASVYTPDAYDSDPQNFDHFANFIGRIKNVNVQRDSGSPNLGSQAQPIPVSVRGSFGLEPFEGTVVGERMFTDADLERVFSNLNELFPVIPSVMLYDAAGDLRGYTAALPTGDDFPTFESALVAKSTAGVREYFEANRVRFMVPGLPPGRYTVVFNNPNYPPIAKEIDLPLDSSLYPAGYPFDFDAHTVRVGGLTGTVKSTAPVAGVYPPLGNAVVYLRHRTVEKFTNTDASGNFAFDNLPSGIYRVEVMRDGYVKTGDKFTLAAGGAAQLSFYMVPSQSNMTGKVFMSKFPAPVTKSGVKVVAYDETYNVENPTEYLPKIEATTNDAGEYELAGIVPGHHYKVSAFYTGKRPATLDVSSNTVIEGLTYLPDIVLRDNPPQIIVKVRKSGDSVNTALVTIKSPKQLITTPVCRVNQGDTYVSTAAFNLTLVPGPNNTYDGEFTISRYQDYYNVYVEAGDGSNKLSKSVTFSPTNQAKTEQYIHSEAIQGGEVQMDKESEEYSGIELDAGALAYSTYTESAAADFSNLVGGFFSALPSVRTIKTAKGELSLTQAIQDLMASEIYNMSLDNASANKPFTLTLKYDKDKAADNPDLRIYQQDENGNWKEVPGDYTVDPMLGVLSVDVVSLNDATGGTSAASTPLGRKRYGMSAVSGGRYVPSATGSQTGRFAVLTAPPTQGAASYSSGFEVFNLPNPFSLRSKLIDLDTTGDLLGSSIADPYPTEGTVIKFNLPGNGTAAATVKFVIYNLAGEKVRTLDMGSLTSGKIYYTEWDGRNDKNAKCASGVYFMLSYINGEKAGTKAHKMAILK